MKTNGHFGLMSLAALVAFVMIPTAEAQQGSKGFGVVSKKQVFEPLTPNAPTGNAGVFVGVNIFDKDEGLSNLAYAVNDAIETAYLFAIELNLIPASNCTLLLSGEPNDEGPTKIVRQHLDQLKRAGATIKAADRSEILYSFLQTTKKGTSDSDVLVVSVSSHGFETNGDAYIMPSDGLEELVDGTAVSLRFMESKMQDSKAGHRILLVDACQERISARSLGTIGIGTSQAFAAAFQEPTGQVKVVSCSPGQLSFEYRPPGGTGHGLFTHGFLRALRGGADADASGIVRLGSVIDYLETYVPQKSQEVYKKDQLPSLNGPVSWKNLPLAKRSSDITATLVRFSQADTSLVLTNDVKAGLLTHLENSSFADPRDRDLVDSIGRFNEGEIGSSALASIVDRERWRWGMAKPKPKPKPVVIPKPDLLRSPFTKAQSDSAQQKWASYLKVPAEYTNSIGMEMRLVPAGTYTMGSNRYSDTGDTTPHTVTISNPFYVSKHELTVGQFRTFARANNYRTEQQRNNWSVRGWDASSRRFVNSTRFSWENPGWSQPDTHPVVHVSWNDGQMVSNWLGYKEKEIYRFLTEAEWEYCCRAGTTTLYATGNDPNDLVRMGNVLDSTGMRQFSSDYQFRQNNQNIVIPRTDGQTFTASVGRYLPNNFGLYDFHGNICEWCQDWYSPQYHLFGSTDPLGAATGQLKSARGGRFDTGGGLAKSFYRNKGEPTLTDMILGIRLAREIRMPR